jgi:hypothetical protein
VSPPRLDRLGPESDSEKVRAAVSRFGEEVLPRMHGDGRMEDRIRHPIHNLLKAIAGIFGRDILVQDEVPVTDISARPDFAVDSRAGRLGFIELKSQEVGIPGSWNHSTKHDRDQWQKLRNLPNVVYTDGIKWCLYHKGEPWGPVALLKGDLNRAGSRLAPADEAFEALIREFLAWGPDPTPTLRKVVLDVAPLCRVLRYQVAERISYERTAPQDQVFVTLASEWRDTLFPNLNDQDFADAYAQTVTFALLLARVDGITFDSRSLGDIAEQLSKQHSLMGQALAILTNSRWVSLLSVVDILRRVVGNINPDKLGANDPSAYALLYETFLSVYDPKLRRKSGTYYTPDEVARVMVDFADQILKERFKKVRGFAARDVHVIDPAMGTGTFLVAIIDSVVSTLRTEYGAEEVSGSHISELFSDRLIGFEIQAAPFAVAEMRLHHTLKNEHKVELPRKEVRFLSNALDDPDTLPLPFGQLYDVLKKNRENANYIKRFQDVMVVIGNPPWRERARGGAPWIELPRDPAIPRPQFPLRPSLDDFRSYSHVKRAFNLSNMWTFFWCWATWKVFEANPRHPTGIVVLITPQAYMTSDSYSGMRGYLRDTCDEGWVIDLTPEGFQPPTATRIFPEVQQPICIGVFARYGPADPKESAQIHYIAVEGVKAEKVEALSGLELDGPRWAVCPRAREAPFLSYDPVWLSYPRLNDLLPWQQPGVTPNRNWVYAPDQETLGLRWRTLTRADSERKPTLFKVTESRNTTSVYQAMPGITSGRSSIDQEKADVPVIRPVGFRSFDRQYLIYDGRVIDRPRRELWQVYNDDQVYVCEPPAYRFTTGPALTFSALVPNVDYFMGHSGGQILPLYRNPALKEPNVAPKLLVTLGAALGIALTAKDLLAYIAAVAAHRGFSERFIQELRAPGVRIPLAADSTLWREAIEIGSEVIWLHTYGERFNDEGLGRPREAPRMPATQRPRPSPAVPARHNSLRDVLWYDPLAQSVIIGDAALDPPGRIDRVSPEVWEYQVGDMTVVRSWFDYRRNEPLYKKRTSPLDNINQPRWTSEFDDELFDLLNVLGRCVALEERQARLLDRVCAGAQVTVDDLERLGVLPPPDAFGKPPRSLVADTLESEL